LKKYQKTKKISRIDAKRKAKRSGEKNHISLRQLLNLNKCYFINYPGEMLVHCGALLLAHKHRRSQHIFTPSASKYRDAYR
jgi:hypothetical protein